MRTMIAAMMIGLMFLLNAGSVAAQEAAGGGDKVVFKKKTIIDFSDVLIEGELTKPEGSYVVSRKLSRFSSIIRLRENFIPELLSSPSQL